MKEKNHNYFYKITNLLNGKYYYGIHSTNNLNDGYFGGGERLSKAIKKYGKENFTKEIIIDYSTRKEASDHEKLIVTIELVKCEDCYNCRTGGDNEFVQIISEETKKKISKANKGKKRSDDFKKLMKELNSKENNKNIGTKRSDETKLKMSIWQKGVPKSEKTKKLLSIASKNPNAINKSIRHLEKAIEVNKKSCIVDNIEFESIKEVMFYFNLSRDIVTLRLKSDKWKNWNLK